MDKTADAEREVPSKLIVPPAIHKQVALKNVQEGESMRTIVFRRLKAIGVVVPHKDPVGRYGRRRQG